MPLRAVAACLFVVFAPVALAGERPQAASTPAHSAAEKARLEALRGQEKHEDAQVEQLRKRVDTLESTSQATSHDIAERDRKIAELRRQLEASQGK
jgi:septal ring factor EnvC (AmiA/AmiB activator)